MFDKVLIANRGEIAVRIIRACRELGIKTVAVYSEADKLSLHTQLADEAVCIGKDKSIGSYLNVTNILSACINTKATAIHPGFGFLSENADFARLCGECGIKFIGPNPEVIETMGNKANARKTMIEAGVPVIPGSTGTVDTIEEALTFAKRYGYPLLIKATAGGGGKGIRIVNSDDELREGYISARQEAKLAFLDDTVYIERMVKNARHIEVQILADEHGNIRHLYERDCSLQRRNQKVIEEAPAFCLSDEKRKEITELAVRAGKAVNYSNAGTLEFLYEPTTENIYFLEMNTRIQVEHPITEAITGIDIVAEQLKIASGSKISFEQKDVKINGFAIECRINAEDVRNNFMPQAGTIDLLHMPAGGGVRIDSCIYQGYKVPPFYDSMLAKVIVHCKDREYAIRKMKRCLYEVLIDGIKTNTEFHAEILSNEKYIACEFDTKFLEREILHK